MPLYAGVSPGFRLRPSLSALRPGRHRGGAPRVAGIQTPAFVERQWIELTRGLAGGRVAGVQTPAFVERPSSFDAGGAHRPVSPGFRLRPSLSVQYVCSRWLAVCRVAGVQTPAFVERLTISLPAVWGTAVSPGFRLRPSLSGSSNTCGRRTAASVAGVQTPAFVERGRRRAISIA